MKDSFYRIASALLAVVCLLLAAGHALRPGPLLPDGLSSDDSPPPAPDREWLIEQFHLLWWGHSMETWARNRWLGVETQQNPMDMWVTQEIIVETRPDYIIECGAWEGGSAAYMASVLSQVNPEGRVISIDIEDKMQEARKLPIVQERVEYIIGSSTDPAIVQRVKDRVAGKRVLVLLDSDHSAKHVLDELEAYWDIVNVGSYVIVQDSNINHPVRTDFGPGPYEAIHDFLAKNDHYEIDKDRERLMLTFCPDGYLRRVK